MDTSAQILHVYADESGNTGPDLVSDDQPIEVTAMVLLAPEQERALATAVARTVDSARTQVPNELKYARLAKTASGRSMLEEVLNALHDCGGEVYFSITEKRYLAASFVVETFLDPLCTEGAPGRLLDPVQRRKAANLVYQVTDAALLEQFLEAWRRGDRATSCATGERVATRLEIYPAEEGPLLARDLRGGLADPFHWPQPEDAPARFNTPTPNTFSFLSLLAIVDRSLRKRGEHAQLIADEDAQFGPVLDQAYRAGISPDVFPGGVSAYGLAGPITQIVGRAERRSGDELGIQIADVVAGLVAAVSRADLARQPLGARGALWNALRRTLLESAPSGWWQVSERMLARATSFEGLTPDRDEWWWARL